MPRDPRPRRPADDLDSELVWWPLQSDGDGGTRLSRPWRTVALLSALALLTYGYLRVDRALEVPGSGAAKATDTGLTGDVIEQLRRRGLLVPVAGVERPVLQGSFGDPRGPKRHHKGMDIPAPRHRPVIAVESGSIAAITDGRLSGLAVRQLSADGRYGYFYAHLEQIADGLHEGQAVRAGQVLGTVGTSGNARGPHLHFEIIHLHEPGGPSAVGDAVDPFLVYRP
ncbi:MAG: M23 family metallopeptidase [Acidobacteriota bacterium]